MENIQNKQPLIQLENVYVEYKTKTDLISAVENINLQLYEGEFLCVLGPSGCGKSTLLNTIAGYIKPNGGLCTMLGKEIVEPGSDRGVVFQSPTLYPWMSVKDNIEFGPKMRGMSRTQIEEIGNHFIKQVNLSGFENNATFELSGGMKQRVALARVLANYPQVILMDEPFCALDAMTRGNMQKLIRDIWYRYNNTLFLITHDIDEALTLGTRIVVMSKRPGKIISEFNTDFTYEIWKYKSNHIQYGKEYINIKDEIMELISQ